MSLFKRANYGATKFDGNYIFSDFSYGLYNLDTPRSLPEQIKSLALIGGRNVWTEKGALVNQYGYNINGQFDEGDTPYLVSSDNSASNNIFVICTNGKVYFYNTLNGLKKYQTDLSGISNIKIAHSGDNIYICADNDNYVFGSVYNETGYDSDYEAILTNVPITNSDVGFSVKVTTEQLKYFWIDKKLVYTTDSGTTCTTCTVSSIRKLADNDPDIETYSHSIEFMPTTLLPDGTLVGIGEKTLHTLVDDPDAAAPLFPEMYWKPEEEGITEDMQSHFLEPKLMAVALNRLWVVDKDNTIFYSSVGALTDFRQSMGAGYFRGFYKDTSEVLSLEEFYSGVLITKETGMYHVTLSTQQYSYQTVSFASTEDYVTIKKLNNIVQKYPGDHVIVGNEVIAFDASSGNLVQAAYVNYLGGLQEGSVLLHGSELDSQGLGLESANRRLLNYSFQEEVLLLYYGDGLDRALLITRGLSLFPRQNDKSFIEATMFGQGFINVTTDGYIIEDFKRGTIVPDITPVAQFEPIGLRGNKLLNGAIIEFTELNGVRYTVTTENAGIAEQYLIPPIIQVTKDEALPSLIYSDYQRNFTPNSFAEQTRWASQKSNVTRMSAPLSGRNGLITTIEFEVNCSFCLLSVRYPDMSQGE